MTRRLLVVEDDRAMADLLAVVLPRRGFDLRVAAQAEEALELLARDAVDVVLADLHLPGMDGLTLCRRVADVQPDVPVVAMTAFGNLEVAVGAIRAGAYDFITKPFEVEALVVALERAVEHRLLRGELQRLRRAMGEVPREGGCLGESPAMRRLHDLLAQVADSDATVLVMGESGTGKEVAARTLHAWSRRARGPFVAVNCAAVPATLLESELFGHARGAFTDARTARDGLFVQAHGGTLFLDEVGDLPLELQPKLLRALQERVVRPLGAPREVPFDARIVTATNRDLESAVEEGRFREDLFYRINVIQVDIPPLRARGGDILLLAHHFLEAVARRSGRLVRGFSAPAARRLLDYPWPGNVRELENCVERAVALARAEEIVVEDLPPRIRDFASRDVLVAGQDPAELVTLDEVERRYILRVLQAVGGNKTQAARVLGLDRKTLYRKLEQYGLAGGHP